MQEAERALLEKTVSDAFEESRSADDVLGTLGWLEMLDAEPRDAIDVVFTALGRTNAVATALDDVIATALGVEPSPDRAVLLPAYGTWTTGVEGLATARVVGAKELMMVSESDSGFRLAVVPIAAAGFTPVRGIDPDAGLHVVRITGAAVEGTHLETAAWEAAVAAGRRAVAHQLSGACRTMLALARTHALERVQFGRPIARFQAVRHRLADALVAIEALDATLIAAWDERGPMTAALAKAAAGRAARTVATHCQQVLAGVGFTTDHAFHRFLKRSLALEGLFGSADDLVVDLGRQLIADRNVPTLIEL